MDGDRTGAGACWCLGLAGALAMLWVSACASGADADDVAIAPRQDAGAHDAAPKDGWLPDLSDTTSGGDARDGAIADGGNVGDSDPLDVASLPDIGEPDALVASDIDTWTSDAGEPDAGADGQVSGDTQGDTVEDADGDSAGDADGGTLPVECADPPPLPRPFAFIENIPGSEDFVFDGLGNLVNIPQKMVLLTKASGQTAVGFPVSFSARGTRYLPGGDLVVASSEIGGVVRFSPEGLEKKLTLGLPNPNGIVVGGDGTIYLSGMGIRRIDPDSGETTLLVDYVGEYAGFDGLTFAPDYGTLYFNEEFLPDGSPVYAMPMGADGPVGEPTVIATIPVVGGKVDGMTADACGKLYVVEMVGRVWRITPGGPVELVAQLPDQPAPGHFTYVAAVNFGSGVGGWARDHLYVMNSEGGVFDVDVGVPGKPEPHLD